MKFYRNGLWLTLYPVPSTHDDPLKNIAASELGIFAIYSYSTNFKNIFHKIFQGISMKFYRDVLWKSIKLL